MKPIWVCERGKIALNRRRVRCKKNPEKGFFWDKKLSKCIECNPHKPIAQKDVLLKCKINAQYGLRSVLKLIPWAQPLIGYFFKAGNLIGRECQLVGINLKTLLRQCLVKCKNQNALVGGYPKEQSLQLYPYPILHEFGSPQNWEFSIFNVNSHSQIHVK